MTQSKLTEGNSKFKGEEVNVARLISLYNEYCQIVLKAKLNENNITTKRPLLQDSVPAIEFYNVIGKK